MINLNKNWDKLLASEFQKEYYKNLRKFLKHEYANHVVYPPMDDIYNALRFTDFDSVSVVILGQDPYHGAGQAHGLSFSIKPPIPPPPSLVNIYKEINSDLGRRDLRVFVLQNGDLIRWAKQGVLLLNTVLSVREGQPGSHRGKGWEILTDYIISLLGEREKPCVFLLWGRDARIKKALVKNNQHLILEAPHPSPLSAYNGFFGCRHFSKTNEFLRMNGMDGIEW